MTAFFSWYIILIFLGWLTFPLTFHLFPALSDRGYTLARAAGLLLWGFIFWLFASLGISQNDLGGIILALAILVGFSIWSLITHYSPLTSFLQTNTLLIVITEILFFSAFAFMAFVRSANPELTGTERPMELMFINGILRSPTFPPQDPWLSGYAISYYYFGYVMTAMLAQFSGVNGSTAHNLMTSLVFALGAIGSFGIVYNLLATSKKMKEERRNSSLVPHSLLAPIFLLLISNFEPLLEVLHRMGLSWTKNSTTGEWTGSFWTWLDMKELSQPPIEPFGIAPERYLWWWRASRVIQDYDMTGSHREVIDEFPFFSFLLGDLHPHVLAIPFGLLAISVALNIFLDSGSGEMKLPMDTRLRISYGSFLFTAIVLGGLAFLNTWDILVAAALIVSAYVFSQARKDGWNWWRLEDVFIFGVPLGILSIILYFPFYLGFSSQAGGILPNFMYVTRGAHLWVMWGTLLIPIFVFIIYQFGISQLAGDEKDISHGSKLPESKIRANWKLGFGIGLGIPLFLFLLTFFLGWLGTLIEKDFVTSFLASQGMTVSQYIAETSLRRAAYIGSLITLLAILIPSIAFLFPDKLSSTTKNESIENHQLSIINFPLSITFVFLLITFGTLLVLAPEFVYLKDQFGYRINTVFKFYYQAWMLWSLAASFGVAYLLLNLRKAWNVIFSIVVGLLVFIGLLYPIFGLDTKTNGFKPLHGFTLNDFDRVKRENPDEAAAVEFLLTAPDGIIAEAIGDGYSAYGRISMLTGLQTVLGWPGHEAQWRGTYSVQGSRRDDINKLYVTARWEEAQTVIQKYNIRYIYIGTLEHTSIRVNEEKFKQYLKPVFQQDGVTIYEVPQSQQK